MKGTWHLFFASLVFLPLWIYHVPLKLPETGLLIFLTLLPDIDLKFKGHRHPFTHSILYPLLWVFWYGSTVPQYLRVGFLLTNSIHLICDLPYKYWLSHLNFLQIYIFESKKPGGTYCCWDSYEKSTAWYILNGVTGLILSGLFFGGLL